MSLNFRFKPAAARSIVWDCKNNNVAANGYIYVTIEGVRYAIYISADGYRKEAYVAKQPQNIKSADIPASIIYDGMTVDVVSILMDAFDKCEELTTVTVGENVTSIHYGAFGSCKALESIFIPASVARMGLDGGVGGGYVFLSSNPELKIYLEATTEPSYGLTGWWNVYDPYVSDNIYLATYLYSDEEPTAEGNYWHYVDGVITEW